MPGNRHRMQLVLLATSQQTREERGAGYGAAGTGATTCTPLPVLLLGPAGRDTEHTPSLLEIPLNFEG